MTKRITIIQGHPDPDTGHFCHALAAAYDRGAVAAGHEVRRVNVAELNFPLLRTGLDFNDGTPPSDILAAQDKIAWAEHLLIVYPLWLGSMPALVKGFFEQCFRPGFAFSGPALQKGWKQSLGGRSARIVVTMGMPVLVFRLFYLSHSLKSLERNILKFCGIGPIRETLIGGIDASGDAKRQSWLRDLAAKGAAAR